MERKQGVIGEIISSLAFILGCFLLFQEFGIPKITGNVISVITINATSAFLSGTLTIAAVAGFLFFRVNK